MTERALQSKRAPPSQVRNGRGASIGGADGIAGHAQKEGVLFVSAHGLDKVNRRAGSNGQGAWRRHGGGGRQYTTQKDGPSQHGARGAQNAPFARAAADKSRANSAPVLQRPTSYGGHGVPATAAPAASDGEQQTAAGATAGAPNAPQPPVPTSGERATPCFLDTWMYQGCKMTKLTASERVSIHVHDEVNNVTRNFVCRRDILLSEMKYFKSYLSHECSIDDLDISVHCDVSIFKWLMEYVHNDPENRPQPDPTVAVSVLISSDFLQMSQLVDESLKYIVAHMQEIIKLPIDLDCINKTLVSRLASLMSYEDLDKIRDRKDKLIGSLFLHKVREILCTTDANGEPCNVLFRCQLCGSLFTEQQKKWSVCEKSSPVITFHGESLSEHVVDTNWDISAFIATQRAKRLSWREIFWRLWAVINDDICKVCSRHFVIAEIGHCCYHESLPRFEPGSSVGVFPCCDVEVQRFEGGTVRQSGCCARSHILSNPAQKEMVMNVISRHPYILIPRGEGNADSNSLTAAAQCASDNDSDTSSSSSDDTFGPEWRRRSRWTACGYNTALFAEGDSLRRSLHTSSSRFANGSSAPSLPGQKDGVVDPSPTPTLPKPASASVPSAAPKRRRKKKSSSARGSGEPGASNGPSGEWWFRLGSKAKQAYLVDVQREGDERRMRALVAALEKRRVDPDKTEKSGQKKESGRHLPPKKPALRKTTPSPFSARTAGFGK